MLIFLEGPFYDRKWIPAMIITREIRKKIEICIDRMKEIYRAMSIEKAIIKYSKEFKVEAPLIHAIIETESRYVPEAISYAGAVGLMQVLPSTAEFLGYDPDTEDLFDIDTNIKYGTKFLRLLMDHFPDLRDVISAYNAGPNQGGKTWNIIHPYTNRFFVYRVYGKYISLKGADFLNKNAPLLLGVLALVTIRPGRK
jgi:hypothetical protein